MKAHSMAAVIAVLLLATAGGAWSEAAAAASGGSHVISRLSFQITGMTRESALRTFLSINPPLREGVSFSSAEDLAAFLDRKRQDLVNDRVFKSVEVSDEPGETVDGITEHSVTLTVVDAFSLFPLPYPSYDSNSGLELGVETHYDNGLGTMTNWYLDMYLVLRTYDDVYGVGKWRIHPRISSLVIAGLPFTLDCLFDHLENIVTEMDAATETEVTVADWTCYKASADLYTSFYFGKEWYYKPEVVAATSFAFEDRLGSSDYNQDKLALTLTNTIGYGRVNWAGNFRAGFDANIGASVSALDRNDVFNVTGALNATTVWYLPWTILDYYGRVHAQYAVNDEPTGLGSWLRGVKDNSMSGVVGVFTNQTLAIDVIPWKGVLDLQIHPFVDAGLVVPGSRAFSVDSDVRVGAGADIALFIDVISNFLIRCTVGMELTADSPLDHIEIILNTGLTY
jgi:hypothetical protein